MKNIEQYFVERAERDPAFSDGFESGYSEFRIGALLRRAREEAGLTQEELAVRIGTKKSAVSRMENHAGDIRLSTLERYAAALGKSLTLELKSPPE